MAKKTDKFNPSEKFNLYQPAFGKKTTIKVYSPRRVGIAYGEIMIKIFSGKNKLKQKRILDAQDGEGKTMLQYVVEDFRNELAIPRVKSLLESGASYEIKNYSGESVMSMLRCLKAEIAPGSLDDKKLVLMQKEIVTFIVRKYLKQPETPSTLSQANIFSQKNISKPIEKNHARSNTRHV